MKTHEGIHETVAQDAVLEELDRYTFLSTIHDGLVEIGGGNVERRDAFNVLLRAVDTEMCVIRLNRSQVLLKAWAACPGRDFEVTSAKIRRQRWRACVRLGYYGKQVRHTRYGSTEVRALEAASTHAAAAANRWASRLERQHEEAQEGRQPSLPNRAPRPRVVFVRKAFQPGHPEHVASADASAAVPELTLPRTARPARPPRQPYQPPLDVVPRAAESDLDRLLMIDGDAPEDPGNQSMLLGLVRALVGGASPGEDDENDEDEDTCDESPSSNMTSRQQTNEMD